MTSTSRVPYTNTTPTGTFDIPLSALSAESDHGPVYIPAPESPLKCRRIFAMPSVEPPLWWKAAVQRARITVQDNSGMLIVASSQLFFSLMNVFVKMLNSLEAPVPAFELIFVRMAITWICCVTYMMIMKVPDPFLGPKGIRLLLVTRGFCGFFGLFGVYYSLQYLSLSDATVLTFLGPMCTAVSGAIILGEDFSYREALAGLCSLGGVVLIARPEFIFGPVGQNHLSDSIGAITDGVGSIPDVFTHEPTSDQRLRAVGVALFGVLGSTGAYTSIRAMGMRAHPLHNLVSFSSQCVLVSAVAMLIMRSPVIIPTRWEWLILLFMIGIMGFIAQVLLTLGLQRETAGRGTMAIYVQIIFASVFEQIFFHTSLSALSILGTLIIMASALYVAITKNGTTQKRSMNAFVSTEEAGLEDGLLDHTEEDDAAETLKEVTISEDSKDAAREV